jgi:hypothetical protein
MINAGNMLVKHLAFLSKADAARHTKVRAAKAAHLGRPRPWVRGLVMVLASGRVHGMSPT